MLDMFLFSKQHMITLNVSNSEFTSGTYIVQLLCVLSLFSSLLMVCNASQVECSLHPLFPDDDQTIPINLVVVKLIATSFFHNENNGSPT